MEDDVSVFIGGSRVRKFVALTFRCESKNHTSPPLGAMPNHGAVNPNMPAGTHNSEGVNIDLYIPRKW